MTQGAPRPETIAWPRSGSERMGDTPHANGGCCCATSTCPTSGTMRWR